MSRRYGRGGFTLTEVLVSVMVLAIIVSAVYTAVKNANLAWQRGQANQIRVETGRGVIEFISRELESASATRWLYMQKEKDANLIQQADVGNPKYGALWFWGTDYDPAAGPVEQVHLRSAADELHFIAPVDEPGRAPRGSLVEVGYWLDGGRLWADGGTKDTYDAIPTDLLSEEYRLTMPPASDDDWRKLASYLDGAWGDNKLRRHVIPCPVESYGYGEPLPAATEGYLPGVPEMRFGFYWWLIGKPETYWGSPFKDTTAMDASALSSNFAYAEWEQSDDSLLGLNIVDIDFIYYHWYYYPKQYTWSDSGGTHTAQEWIWGVRMVDDNPDPVPYKEPYITANEPVQMKSWPVPNPDGTKPLVPVIVLSPGDQVDGAIDRLNAWSNHCKRGERLLIVPKARDDFYNDPLNNMVETEDKDQLIGQSFIIQDNAWDGDEMLIRIAGDRITANQFYVTGTGAQRAYYFVVSKGEWNSLADMVYRVELTPPSTSPNDWATNFSQTTGIPARDGDPNNFPTPADMDKPWHFNNLPVMARGDAFEGYDEVKVDDGSKTWLAQVRAKGTDSAGQPGWTGADGMPAAVEVVLVARDSVPSEHKTQVFNAMIYLKNSGRWGE